MRTQFFNSCLYSTKEKTQTTKPFIKVSVLSAEYLPHRHLSDRSWCQSDTLTWRRTRRSRTTWWNRVWMNSDPSGIHSTWPAVLSDCLLPLAALMHRHVPPFVFKCSQERFLLIIQTCTGFRVVNQDVTHQLHLPLLTVVKDSAISASHRRGVINIEYLVWISFRSFVFSNVLVLKCSERVISTSYDQ